MQKDKSAKILVLDSSGPVRMMLKDAMNKVGFSNVQSFASLNDILGTLESEEVDWILTSIDENQDVNVIQMLNLINSQSVLKKVRVSLFVSETEQDILALAYEKGLLCHFSKPTTKDLLMKEVDSFWNAYTQQDFNDVKLSASYLNFYLYEQKNYSSILDLNKKLLEFFPANYDYFLEIAKAHFFLSQKEESKNTFVQASMLIPNKKEKIIRIAKSLFGNEFEIEVQDENSENSLNILGVSKCLIVDPDEEMTRLLAKSLKSLGVEECLLASNGKEAWEIFEKNENINLVIQEWALEEMPSSTLIQRLHQKNPSLPIVITNKHLNEEDEIFMKELGIQSILQKPFEESDVTKVCIQLFQQHKSPSEMASLEIKIRQLLASDSYEEAVKEKEVFFEEQEISDIYRKKIMAEFSFYEKNYELARDLALEVTTQGIDTLYMLNIIGKCLMKLGDTNAALKCFEKIQAMCPMSMERLCTIAEASSDVGKKNESEEALNRAKEIDSESDLVKKTEASIEINTGDVEEAKKILASMPSLNSIISHMNNKAIISARSGRIEEGIECYKKTIASIPLENKNFLAIVSYNLALAYSRAHKLEDALEELELALQFNEEHINKKANSLSNKIKHAIANGTELELSESEWDLENAENNKDKNVPKSKLKINQELHQMKYAHRNLLALIEASPGDICCFKIFINYDELSELGVQLLEQKTPRFIPRDAITREKASGLEKMRKK